MFDADIIIDWIFIIILITGIDLDQLTTQNVVYYLNIALLTHQTRSTQEFLSMSFII